MEKNQNLVSIAVDIPAKNVFTYITDIPLKAGQRVKIPFGKRKLVGVVTGPGVPGDYNYKNVLKVYDDSPVIPEYLIQLAKKMSEEYFSSIGQTLGMMVKNLSLKKVNTRKEEFSFTEKKTFEPVTEGLFKKIMNELELQKKKIGIVKFSKTEEKKEFFLEVSETCKGSCILSFSNLNEAKNVAELLLERYEKRVIFFTGEKNKTEKGINWKRMLEEKNLIVIGTRICLFSPLSDLSVVIVDEPSEFGHKEQQTPAYNSREIGLMISKILNIPIIFTTFQPDITDILLIKKDIAALIKSDKDVQLPKIIISQIQDRVQKQILTDLSKHLLEKTVIEKNKVVIIHNVKGYARLVMCKKCGSTLLCEKCGSIVAPVSEKFVFCNKCKKFSTIPSRCSKCKKGNLSLRQPGIQKIFEYLKNLYPDFNISILSEKKPDFNFEIIIGTQHIVQYLEQISPSLVIFVNADAIAARSVFRSEEKFFLLVEKIKRLMQGQDKTIIIQTRNPGLDVYGDVTKDNPERFYKRELSIRESLGFPPFGELIEVSFSGKKWQKNKEAVFEEIKKLGEIYEVSSGVKEVFWWKVPERKKAFEFLENIVEKYRITHVDVDTTPYF